MCQGRAAGHTTWILVVQLAGVRPVRWCSSASPLPPGRGANRVQVIKRLACQASPGRDASAARKMRGNDTTAPIGGGARA
jgi:hypothetical protein